MSRRTAQALGVGRWESGPNAQGPTPKAQGARPNTQHRAFTLIEMLVVLAITAILMVILFVPLSRALDMTRRGRAQADGQNNVREALSRVVRDLSNAMEVLEPRPLNVYGYAGAWNPARNRPQPGNTSEAYVINNAMAAMRLPKHRWFCTGFDHYVTQPDVDTIAPGAAYDLVALDTCPRHPGSAVEFRPLSPLEPDDRLTVYYVGLKNPLIRDGANNPLYQNLLLFRNTTSNELNTYGLYRVEFDPRDARFANWNLGSGAPNPNFCYDTAVASNGLPFWENWRKARVAVMDTETSDAIRWVEVENATKLMPQPICTFSPTAVDSETAQPNRLVAPSASIPSGPPLEYVTDHPHWTGLASDGARSIPDTFQISTSASAPVAGMTFYFGPRIQVFSPSAGGAVVFDTAAGIRNRLVSYDSTRGRVTFAVRRQDVTAGNALDRDYYSAAINLTNTTASLLGDTVVDTTGLPSSFGAVMASPRFDDRVAGGSAASGRTLIVPGSEVLQIVDTTVNPPRVEPMRRLGWSGLPSPELDRIVAQNDLEPDQYSIDYSTGEVTLSEKDPNFWSSVGGANAVQLRIKYEFQTNRGGDVVKVSYVTRDLFTVNVGVVQYTRGRQEVIPFEVSQKVVIRNQKR